MLNFYKSNSFLVNFQKILKPPRATWTSLEVMPYLSCIQEARDLRKTNRDGSTHTGLQGKTSSDKIRDIPRHLSLPQKGCRRPQPDEIAGGGGVDQIYFFNSRTNANTVVEDSAFAGEFPLFSVTNTSAFRIAVSILLKSRLNRMAAKPAFLL